MASFSLPNLSLVLTLSLLLLFPSSLAHEKPTTITFHNGRLLTGNLNLALIWYGNFGRPVKNNVRAFIKSLNFCGKPHPQVSDWWKVVEGYQSAAKLPQKPITVKVVKQIGDPSYSVGKVITTDFLKPLIQQATGGDCKTIPVIFTDKDVTAQGLCMGKCALHGVLDKTPYLLVGNPVVECPGACAWPYMKSPDHRNAATLKPIGGSIGGDAILSAFAQGIAELVTNPYGTGFFLEGRKITEAATACQGIFGSGGSKTGSAGKVSIDKPSGGAYNAYGNRGKKFLVPAIWNPKTKSCYTLM